MNRDMLSDGHDEGNFSLNGFLNGTGCLMSSNIYSSGVRLKLLHCLAQDMLGSSRDICKRVPCLSNSGQDRTAKMLSIFPWCYAAYYVCTPSN